MKISQSLPLGLAVKWERLLSYQGGDTEALALAAVELLWEKYGKDVEKNERDDLAYRQKLAAECARTLSQGIGMTEDELARSLLDESRNVERHS